jgi:hypothetical protein
MTRTPEARDNDEDENARLIHLNGVDGASGDYLVPPLSAEAIADILLDRGEATPRSELRQAIGDQGKPRLGPRPGIDPSKLDQAGWGIVFAGSGEAEVRNALQPLIELRRQQAGSHLFRDLADGDGYVANDGVDSFLHHHHVGPGRVDPEDLPYYLLLVGSPEAIPFELEYRLNLQFAVGRIDFASVDEYRSYARSVAEHETMAARRTGRAAFFGCHTFRATGITAYLANGGALEHAQEMAAHESPRTTKLYDRTKERLTQDEVERIRL